MIDKNIKVIWFSDPHKFGHVDFDEFENETEESTYFENNGNGKYFYAFNKITKRYQKAGKVVRDFVLIPLFVAMSEFYCFFISIHVFLIKHVPELQMMFLYSILMLMLGYYCLSDNDVSEIPNDKPDTCCRATG